MILIFSEEGDIITSKVIEWLIHYKVDFRRINKEDCEHVKFKVSSNDEKLQIEIGDGTYTLNVTDISFVWYRRGNFKSLSKMFFVDFNIPDILKPLFHNHLNIEFGTLHNLFYHSTRTKCLNYPTDYYPNKLIILQL